MKAECMTKLNGVWYSPGDELPENKGISGCTETSDNASEESTEEEVSEEPVFNEPFSKNKINRMSTEELRKLAFQFGIKNADAETGKHLKEVLIAEMGL